MFFKGIPESPTLQKLTTSIHTGNLELSVVQVYLEWLPGYDGGERVTYKIYYRQAGETQQETMEIRPACNCYTIDDELEANKDYEFFVVANNAFGPSAASNVMRIRTAG